MSFTPDTSTRAATEQSAISAALATVQNNISTFDGNYPDDTTTDNRYELRPAQGEFALGANRGWTTSFWTGQQWLAWELTGDDSYRESAERYAADFGRRIAAGEDLDTHDLGFLTSLASVPAWRLQGDEKARETALAAAELLMGRFLEPAGIIQAWGDLSDPNQRGRTIIDSLMNLPLLTWAGQQTGDPKFADAVQRHATQLRENIFRPDDSTFHTFYWDVETGAPRHGATEQGAHDGSCWARGQAWGIYGFALNYEATGDERLLEASWRCAEYFLDRLPSDLIPHWDLAYAEDSGAPRDSSSAAIAACGFFELAKQEQNPERAARADALARRILASLEENYTPAQPSDADALLLHSVYDLPKNVGVDEGTLWGDYFYLEALTRATRPDWTRYW
tara:strand:- start:15941 stop:17122 length:1182 start_codon:yes stop_codon:yes gene_type:complete